MGRITKSGSTSQITFPNGATLKQDSSGLFGFYDTSGTEIFAITLTGKARILSGPQTENTTTWYGADASGGNAYINVPTGKLFAFAIQGNDKYYLTATACSRFAGIATAGLGLSAIYASSIQSQSNAAPTTVSYTPPATAGTYRISANLEITTATTITFKNKLTYTSASGAATTDRPVWERQNSATILAEPTANTADRFVMEPYQFTIDNSAGAIALADDAGTYTTCAYRLGVILEQLA